MSMPPTPPGGGPVGGPGRRWIIAGVVFAAVAALVVGLLVWQARSADDVGSADDGVDRTVGLLTEKDPVCDDWIRYADELAAQTKAWSEIDDKTPAPEWDAEHRQVYENAGAVMQVAADRFESLSPNARSVVLKELIGQTVHYLRTYIVRLPHYAESDSFFAGAAVNFSSATTFMCTAVPLVRPVASSVARVPSKVVSDSDLLDAMVDGDNTVCGSFADLIDRQNTVLRGWEATDPSVPATQWTPDQRQLNMAVKDVLGEDAERVRTMSQQPTNPILADLLSTYAAYVDAYLIKLSAYEPDDNQIWRVATYLGGGIVAACETQ